MEGSPEVRFVTWFDTKRGIALHFYPFVPDYPASHGCVRLGDYAAQLIHNNSKIGETEVVVDGPWTFAR
jgi:lipoprotein-anchoring transpeptidase ErfK/SrfK